MTQKKKRKNRVPACAFGVLQLIKENGTLSGGFGDRLLPWDVNR
jgi:hypothetical protein